VRYAIVTALLAATAPLFAQSTVLKFEVASIKRNTTADLSNPAQTLPNGDVRVMNTPVRNLILRAYPLPTLPIQVLGLPSWADIGGDRYDVIAKGKPAASAEEQQQMWRALFTERMKLVAHYETREQPGYNLVFARTDRTLGSGLKPSSLDCATQTRPLQSAPGTDMKAFALSHCGGFFIDRDQTMYSGGATMEALVRMMIPAAGRQVADHTELQGFYSVAFRFQRIPSRSATDASPDDPPSLMTAVQEQLGLKLESAMTQAQVLVIDHIERPTEN
jgi:uncharacterized protein (TIGR03435 family)